jgi:outer membrane receptor for ferrienterochelin and colicin
VGTAAQNGQYRYRTNFRLGYDYNLWGAGLTWLHLPSIRNASAATAPTTTLEGADAYDLFNLDAHWNVTSTVAVRFGVDNLLDKSPNIYGANPGLTQALGSTLANYYDVLGRRYYAGVKITL